MRTPVRRVRAAMARALAWASGCIGAAALLAVLWAPAAVARSAPSVTPPSLPVSGAALMVTGSDQFLYGHALEAGLPIASTTKIMTALITLEHERRLGRVFAQNDWYPAPVDSQIGLVPGERMTVRDLLVALLLPSADDAAEDLAYNVGGGSVSRFVTMMNAEARALGLRHTHYTTPIGLDTPGNYSSPGDLARLSAYVLSASPFFRRVVAEPSAVLTSGRYRRVVVNRNDLVARFRWINGVKTGHTRDAGYVLVASGTRDGMTLIGDVLGTSSESARDAAALALLDYGFRAFHPVNAIRAGQVMARPAVTDEGARRAVVIAAQGFQRVLPRAAVVRVAVRVPRSLSGPLPRGAVVGRAIVSVGRRRLARVPLKLKSALPAPSPVTQAAHFLTSPPTLIVLGTALAIVALVAIRRRHPGAMAARHLEEG